MSPQRLACVLPALLAAACAAGEPVDTLDRDLALGEDEPTLIDAELVVEVTDAGRSVIADAVWLADATGDPVEAYCMVHAGLGRCETWFLEAQTEGPITLHAEVCGQVYSQSLAFALDPAADDLAWSSHVGIEADASACGRTKPGTCAEVGDAAFEVTTVDEQGNAIEVSSLTVEREGDPAAPADCMDAAIAPQCTDWASQQRSPGRYRAFAMHCGKMFRTEWVDVRADDSGCKVIPEAVALVVGAHDCVGQ